MCLKRLGFLQIPVAQGVAGPPGPAGSNGANGANGANGTNGTNGTTRLFEVLTNQASLTVGSSVNLASYSLPANQLVNDGDSVVIDAWYTQNVSTTFANAPLRRILFGGVSCTILGGLDLFSLNTGSYYTKVEVIKTSATTAKARVLAVITPTDAPAIYEVNLTGLNFTVSNNIQYQIFQSNAAAVTLNSLTIDKIAS